VLAWTLAWAYPVLNLYLLLASELVLVLVFVLLEPVVFLHQSRLLLA
jgi:hypothetical protein